VGVSVPTLRVGVNRRLTDGHSHTLVCVPLTLPHQLP